MDTSATYVKNNFGVIMKTIEFEDVIVRKNGRAVAKITRYEEVLDTGVTHNRLRDGVTYYGYEDREISYQEFIGLTSRSENRYELIFGKVYMLASPKVNHQSVVSEIHGRLYNFFKGKGCQPFIAPFDITLVVDGEKNVVQPDLGIICDMNEQLDERGYYMGTPDLIVEVLSPSTRNKDMILKTNLYMGAGVKEYWIIDIEQMTVFVYNFKNQILEACKTYRFGEVVKSKVFDDLEVEF